MSTALTDFRVLLSLLAGSTVAGAATLITPGAGNVPIQRVVYTIGGSDVVQTTEASGVSNTANTEVYLKSLRIAGGTDLTHFNTGLAKVFNVNPELGTTKGVGVFNNGAVTPSFGNLTAYGNAVAGTSMDTDIRNYGYHDTLTPGPTNPAVADLDLQFSKALNLEDYLVVTERWGNSSFQLLALAADGLPYAGANTLQLGGPGDRNNGYGMHDWNTGFSATGNESHQAQALTLVSVAKFFEGTGIAAGPVYGFRIFNYDEADVKILGVSANTFSDNPDNPNIVPEPSVLLPAMSGALLLAFSRKRRKTGE